jgi:hypothetical protein
MHDGSFNPVFGPVLSVGPYNGYVFIKTIVTIPSGSVSTLPSHIDFSVTCQGAPYRSVTLAELEIIDGGSNTGDIIGGGSGWSPITGTDNRIKTGLATDLNGRVTESLRLFPNELDDGDVVRIQCWEGGYLTGTLKAEIDLVGATLTVQLQDPYPAAAQASTAGSGNAADGKLSGRVTFGGTGVNGVPLLLQILNSATTTHDFLFESRAASGAYACTVISNSDQLLSKTTATVSGNAGVAEQDVFWHCPAGAPPPALDQGTFRIYWDRDVNGAITAADLYGQVTQTASGPIN